MSNSIHKGFSRFERNGIIFLCALILFSVIGKNYILHYFIKPQKLTAADRKKITLLQQQISNAKDVYAYSSPQGSYTKYGGDTSKYIAYTQHKKKYDEIKIEVNSANAQEYEKLYGIGKVLSQRIVTFRDKLGGFYSVEQVKDVYGIEDSVFKKFKNNLLIRPAKISKININTASFEELIANPYFFSTVAKQIIGYRSKVRPFASIDDIKNLYFIKDHPEHYNKMLPYVSLN